MDKRWIECHPIKDLPRMLRTLPVDWDCSSQKWWKKENWEKDYRLEIQGKTKVEGFEVSLRITAAANRYYVLKVDGAHTVNGRNWRTIEEGFESLLKEMTKTKKKACTLWVCRDCGHEVLAEERPHDIMWTDAHTCHFIESKEEE
jgi:hypothetical protein